ncbi:MAG: MFS transporter [Anaerolineae bacterium]|nr:MFS transporter [Anaerolineae bacterium]
MTENEFNNLPHLLQGDGKLKCVLRRLVQADKPIPPQKKGQIAANIQHNYKWNYWVSLLDGINFWFGSSFASTSTLLPLFLNKLDAGPLAIGLLAVLAQAGWSLPQLFTANFVEQLPRKKPIVYNIGFFLERLPIWAMVLIAVLASRYNPQVIVTLFLLAFAWHKLGAGIIATAWQDLIARCFPVERRGRFFGVTNFFGTGVGIIGAALSIQILNAVPFPTNFVYNFGLAAIFITISWIFLGLTREPLIPINKPPQSNREFWGTLPAILKQDHNFRRFLVARTLIAFGEMGSGFLTVAALNRWHIPDSTVGVYTSMLLIGQTAGNLLAGFLADRLGHKLSIVCGALGATLSFTIAWIAPNPLWYYATFICIGISYGALITSGILVVMEFCQSERRPTYTGLANTVTGIAGGTAPLVGAILATQSYELLFAASAVSNLLGLLLMQWWVQEPRWADKSHLAIATNPSLDYCTSSGSNLPGS